MARRSMILVAAALAVVSIAYGIRAQTPTLAPPRDVYFAQKSQETQQTQQTQQAQEVGEAVAEDIATPPPAPTRAGGASLSRFVEVPLNEPGILSLNLDEIVPEPPAMPVEPPAADPPAAPRLVEGVQEPAIVPTPDAQPMPAPVGAPAAIHAPAAAPVADAAPDDAGPRVGLSLRAMPSAAALPTPAAVRTGDVGIDIQMPSLRVSTAGPDTIVVGRPAAYELSLANRGEIEARDVSVMIALPSWVDLESSRASCGAVSAVSGPGGGNGLAWDVPRVAAGAEETATLSLVPREGRGFELAVDWTLRPKSSVRQITVNEPKLKVQLAGPERFDFAAAADWTVLLTNPGTGDAHDVVLTVQGQAETLASLPVGTIEAGGQCVVDLRLAAGAEGAGLLRAVAANEQGLEAADSREYVACRGRLHLELQGSDFEYAGTQPVYQVRLINIGNAVAHGVRAQLSLPHGAEYAGGLESPQVSAKGVTWDVDTLEPGAEKVYQIACKLRLGAEHEFVVIAGTPDGLTASDSLVTQVDAVADLKLEIVDPQGPRAVGERVDYEIHITNRGAAAAKNIYIAAVCPPEVEPVDVTGSAAVEGGQIFFRGVPKLEAGEKIVHKVTVKAEKPGAHLFRVVVRCDDPETRLASEETSRFYVRSSKPQGATAALIPPHPLR